MKSGESIADFLARTMAIVVQMRAYGKNIVDQTIVEKLLRSLVPKFDCIVAAIEESKDLSVFIFDELIHAHNRKKLDTKSKKCIYIVHSLRHTDYIIH